LSFVSFVSLPFVVSRSPSSSSSGSRTHWLSFLRCFALPVPSQTLPCPPSQLPTSNSTPPVELPSFLDLDLPLPLPTLPTPLLPPLHPPLKVPNSTTSFFLLLCPRRPPKLFVRLSLPPRVLLSSPPLHSPFPLFLPLRLGSQLAN